MAKTPGRPPIDLGEKIRDLFSHTEALGPESQSPIAHYRRTVNANFTLIDYVDRRLRGGTYESVKAKHLALLHRFVLGNLLD